MICQALSGSVLWMWYAMTGWIVSAAHAPIPCSSALACVGCA